MNKSKIKKIAKEIVNKLNTSPSKDICLYTNEGKYKIEEYDKEVKYPFCGFGVTVIEFNYRNREIPTIEEVQQFLEDTYLNVVNPFK